MTAGEMRELSSFCLTPSKNLAAGEQIMTMCKAAQCKRVQTMTMHQAVQCKRVQTMTMHQAVQCKRVQTITTKVLSFHQQS